jgi:hypothetical protein
MSSVATLLADHVTLRVTCVDRVICAGYIAGLQSEGMVVRFLVHRGYEIPSPVGFRTIHERLVDQINRFAGENALPVVRFERGVSKEAVAKPYLEAAERAGTEGVVLIGKAQERLPGGWRGFRRGGSDSHPHFVYRRQALYVDHYYFYVFDREWGPGWVKLCPYAPYPIWSWCNGHEWLKRQLARDGVEFTALDNGLWKVSDPALARRHAARLAAGHLRGFLDRWMGVIPGVIEPGDRRAGFHYAYSIRQMEVSDTAVFDRPASGRAFFTAAIRDHLDLGRPEKVRLVVDRRITSRTPGRFATEVITKGVDPTLQIHYKSSKVKAYFKESRALRVETTINNPRDFDVRKTLCAENWRALRRVGAEINARFLEGLGESAPPPPDVTALEEVVLPSTDDDGLRAAGLRFGDPRVMALLATVAAFAHIVGGLTNAGLSALVASLLDRPYTHRQATYDLRRLRRKGLIERVPGRHLYRVTDHGRAVATLLTKVAARIVVPALSELETPLSPSGPAPRPMVAAWRTWQRELDAYIAAANIAA